MTPASHIVRELGHTWSPPIRTPLGERRLKGDIRMPTADSADLELAELAHRLWCQGMIAEGWSPGPFDAAKKTHDALVKFEDLDIVDRHSTVIGVESLEIVDRLRAVVDYPRGDDREFCAGELSVGLRVGFSDDADQLGTVLSWEEDSKWPGCLRTITVRWDSGEVNVHGAAEREIRRLSP